MAKRIVVWAPFALLLSRVQFAEDGQVKAGNVENGYWRYEHKGEEILAKYHGGGVANRWKAPAEIPSIEVPDDLDGDYNQVIYWATAQLEKQKKWPDTLPPHDLPGNP